MLYYIYHATNKMDDISSQETGVFDHDLQHL